MNIMYCMHHSLKAPHMTSFQIMYLIEFETIETYATAQPQQGLNELENGQTKRMIIPASIVESTRHTTVTD